MVCSLVRTGQLVSTRPKAKGRPEVLIDISCHVMDGLRLMGESEKLAAAGNQTIIEL